ncbi:MAG: hypothetical protein DRI56_05190 [Chloroflexota bacterium]|nr:MAG: hypothetical protein DRI56_05190 [Chloroflexota bacterium]
MNMANMADFVGAFLGFVFTLLVFSYILGDNPLFRLAAHIFIGVSAGYAAIITVYNVLIPKLISPLLAGSTEEKYLSIALLILSLFLFAKITPLKQAGNWVMAILVGIGAAAAIGGAITGTLLPQMLGTINSFDTASSSDGTNVWMRFLNGGIVVLGTVTTLIYFHFGTQSKDGHPPQRAAFIDTLGKIGQIFIATTFGVLFAGVYFAALAALIERLSFLWDFIADLLVSR